MSLINDALKRANQAHANSPSTIPVGSLLQPMGSAPQQASAWPFMGLALLLGAVLTLTVLLFWQTAHRDPIRIVHAPGITTAEEAASVGISTASSTVDPVNQEVAPDQSRSIPVGTLLSGLSKPVHARTAETGVEPSATETVVVAPPPTLKLQGLVYRQTGASAVVSGKTVYIGDRVLNARVTDITRDSVVLNRNGERVVLLLD